jgi:hypothetical protein
MSKSRRFLLKAVIAFSVVAIGAPASARPVETASSCDVVCTTSCTGAIPESFCQAQGPSCHAAGCWDAMFQCFLQGTKEIVCSGET